MVNLHIIFGEAGSSWCCAFGVVHLALYVSLLFVDCSFFSVVNPSKLKYQRWNLWLKRKAF